MSKRSVSLIVLVALVLCISACSQGDGGVTAADPASTTAEAGLSTGSSSVAADSPDRPAPADDTVSSGAATEVGSPLRALPPAGGIPVAKEAAPSPVALRVPDLGVAGAAVRPVGVDPNGEYEVPSASEVGWYRFGSAPGQEGPSVLAGHIAYDGRDGVFRYLSSAEIGSAVEVTLDDGTSLEYEIVELVTYDKTALPDDIFTESGPDRLVLITCGGRFNPSLRSYESNVVAYAEPVTG